jgi:TfoX/Sxy family transcriptional regulator of competence genes
MASYTLNKRAVANIRKLIETRRYVLDSNFRAAEWRHKSIELAAHDLLQVLDKKAGIA